MNRVEEIAAVPAVRTALSTFESDLKSVVDLAIAIQQIPSPTFHEGERAACVKELFKRKKLERVEEDELHNVYGLYPGNGEGQPTVISAHLDTVFSPDVDLTVRFEGPNSDIRRVYGPGLADNSLGVAGLVMLAQTLHNNNLFTESDIWLVANVCEEGLGDLRGMRAVVERFGSDAAYIVVEGGSFGLVFHEAIGVNRFLIEVQTPGGHSWGDFGKPNAIHVLSKLVTQISDIEVPTEPKTTFNVGVIEGGTTINTVASHAKCQVDLRSAEKELLDKLTNEVRRLAEEANDQPNVQISMRQIGERPSGRLALKTPIVQMAAQALETAGSVPAEFLAGSTDANVPISLGISSVCIGLAKSGNTHRTDEFIDTTMLPKGLGQLLLLTLASAGYDEDRAG